MTSPFALRIRRLPLMLRRLSRKAFDFSGRRAEFYRAYWQHAAKAIGGEVFEIGDEYLQIARDGRFTIVQFHHVNIDTLLNKRLVDDKSIVSRLVRASGFRAPKYAEYSIDSIATALAFLERSGGNACVVKPKSGSGGRGVTTSITTKARLITATLSASNTLTIPALMIEEQMPGDSFRLLYLRSELIHAVRRGRCSVAGNGRDTIARLVERETQARLQDSPLRSLEPLGVDFEMQVTLADQGLSLGSIPAEGELVRVKNVSNQNERRDQQDVTRLVHADYHLLAAKVMRELGAELIGIDVMSVDISLPPHSSGAAVLEINIPPGLHYHELTPATETFTNVGARILTALFADRPAAAYTGSRLHLSEQVP